MPSGILLVNKETGITSAKLTRKIQQKFAVKKMGHGGTLDPFATGLLVLLLDEGTKVSRFILHGDKTYEAEALIGTETDTGDLDGKIKAQNSPAPIEKWEETKSQFIGKIQQVPPMHSAIKYKGEPLYKIARRGEIVELAPRDVEIKEITILSLENNRLRFRVKCGGGTYIRSLARDWAIAAGTSAHLVGLCRTEACSFHLDQALSSAQLDQIQDITPYLIPIDSILKSLRKLACPMEYIKKIREGNSWALNELMCNTIGLVHQHEEFLLTEGESTKPLAIISRNPQKKIYTIERVFN